MDAMIDVWVEMFTTTTSSSDIKSSIGSCYRLGRTSSDAYQAADLMRKAQESRKAAESVVGTCGNGRRKSMDGALEKLRQMKGHTSSISDNEVSLLVILTDTNEEHHALYRHVFPANKPSTISGTSDLTGLTYMEEPNVLTSLQERYESHQCYTSIASILVALNPYNRLSIYSPTTMMSYRQCPGVKPSSSLSPHIFALAETAYTELNRPFSLRRQSRPVNQSIIVCGESGSGKTESSKYLMRYLANRSHTTICQEDEEDEEDMSHERLIERQVLEANHILEAFGNANTLLNHNSSRFGKFTRLYFSTSNLGAESGHGQVVGASTTTYLLEKSRLVRQNKGERNFHIFYQLFAGANHREMDELHLSGLSPSSMYYICQGDTLTVPGIDDGQWFSALVRSMGILGFHESSRWQIFRILGAILHLGNISFIDHHDIPGASQIDPETEISMTFAADLLGLNTPELLALFRQRLLTVRMKTPTEWIEKNLSPPDAIFNRDSMAKLLYSNLFNWIVERINDTLSNTQDLPWIGILDVFGFESFQTNSFEQFCINFANEMLQQHFNHEILLSEQKEYAKEAILWSPINVPDNQATIDLISGSGSQSILSLIDSACRMRGTTVDAFVESIVNQCQGHDRFQRLSRSCRNPRHGFIIHHYAGHVIYDATEFMIKNNDCHDIHVTQLYQQSHHEMVRQLFVTTASHTEQVSNGRRRAQTTFSSVSATFKRQLSSLMDTLKATNAYFVRCIKPNTESKSWLYNPDYVRPQLRCGGLVEAVRMLKVGFPTRVSFDAVYEQYSPLLHPPPVTPLNRRDFSQAVLFLFGLRRNEYQLGLTKCFFRAGKRAFLEHVMNREEKLSSKDMKSLMGFINRKRWQRLIGTVKSTCVIWRSVYVERLIDQWRSSSRILIIYRRSLIRLLHNVRRRISIDMIGDMLHGYTLACHAMGKVRQERMEQERLRMEEEHKQKEFGTELQREKQRIEREDIALAAATARAAAAVPDTRPSVSQEMPIRVDSEPSVITSSGGGGGGGSPVDPAPIAAIMDTKRIAQLEADKASLQQQLTAALAEVDRLKDVVDQLDDINNRLVEDLMNELVLRTQVQEETIIVQSPKSVINQQMDGFQANGGFVPTASNQTRTKSLNTALSAAGANRRNDSECSIQ